MLDYQTAKKFGILALFLLALSIIYTTMVLREEKTIESQGGMSNELYNTIARVTDGIYEGTARVYVAVFL